jgi:hypothetical protein
MVTSYREKSLRLIDMDTEGCLVRAIYGMDKYWKRPA